MYMHIYMHIYILLYINAYVHIYTYIYIYIYISTMYSSDTSTEYFVLIWCLHVQSASYWNRSWLCTHLCAIYTYILYIKIRLSTYSYTYCVLIRHVYRVLLCTHLKRSLGISSVLQDTTTHCNAPQHTVIHYNKKYKVLIGHTCQSTKVHI